jgi:two-component system LytT family response regulator
MSGEIRVLVVDDEDAARERIRDLLAGHGRGRVVGEAASGAEAVERIRALAPDVVFLDVQMPGGDGFEVIEAIGARQMPVTVFTSGYADFALRAFEAYALDYLHKPFDEARFRTALERAAEAVDARRGKEDPRLEALLSFLHAPGAPRYPQTLAVKAGEQYRFVAVADVDYVEADGNHIRLIVGKAARVLHRSLTDMEERVLDPERFVRIHRSTIVNVSRIASAEPLFHGDLQLTLHDGTRLTCTRRYRARLEERVHFTA